MTTKLRRVISPSLTPQQVPTEPVWPVSVALYHQMIGAGMLTEDDPVELLNGWLVTKMPKNPRHSLATQLIRDALARLLTSGWHVRDQEPITLATSEPEPDVAIVRGNPRVYHDSHPTPADVAVLVEVADATLQRDRTLKLHLYAEARIPLYWIVNLPEHQIEVYSAPAGSGGQATYSQSQKYMSGDLVPVIVDEEHIGAIAVGDLLP
jgi:Uma2 family endonuclease